MSEIMQYLSFPVLLISLNTLQFYLCCRSEGISFFEAGGGGAVWSSTRSCASFSLPIYLLNALDFASMSHGFQNGEQSTI